MTQIVLASWEDHRKVYDGLPRRVREDFRFYLTSYSPGRGSPFDRYLEYLDREGIPGKYIIDSGAFTAWTLGKEVILEEYAHWIDREIRPRVGLFDRVFIVGLDAIPGSVGTSPTQIEVLRAAEETFKNALCLRDEFGIPNIPAHHQGEPLSLIGDYLDAGFNYIGISPRHASGTPNQAKYAGEVFRYLVRDRKTPLDRFPALHCFGKIAPTVLRECPFWTADSTTWINGAKFGIGLQTSIGCRSLGRSTNLRGPSENRWMLMRTNLQELYRLQEHFRTYWKEQGVHILSPSGLQGS